MFHRCFDFYDDHAAVKLLFLYWHPDTGLILYMWWVFTLNLIFFFFLNQCILFVMNVRVLVVDHCHWILSAAAAAVAVRSAGGGVERCSYPTVWFFFFNYSYLINLLRLLLERVERLLFSIYCCTYCNITVLLHSSFKSTELWEMWRVISAAFIFHTEKKNQPGLARSTFILFYLFSQNFISLKVAEGFMPSTYNARHSLCNIQFAYFTLTQLYPK